MNPAMTNEKTTHIYISGPDAEPFLQGMLTCDLLKLDATPVLAAACNQKGRIIANFWIWRDNADFYVTLPTSMSNILISHLQKYVLRSKVNFEPSSSHDTPSSRGLTTGSRNNNTNSPLQPIWILPETSEQFTPQMIDLEKHGDVSFTKGCYLGQEIIARTEHLGKLKRHLYEIQCDGNNLTVADDIKNEKGQKLGTVVAIIDNRFFAVIEDRAMGETLYVNEVVINDTRERVS